MKMTQTTAVALFTAALLLSQGGCKSGGDTDGRNVAAASAVQCQVTGQAWELDLASLAGVGGGAEKPNRPITLVFDKEGRVHGCAGVNQYFGPVEISEGDRTLRFGSLGCTMMAGRGIEYERAFLDVLAAVDSYDVAEGALLLKSDGKAVARLTAVQK